MTDSPTERRRRFRELLARPSISHPGSVFDAVSARLAQAAGYELGIFAGSVASHVVLGAPDLVVLTLTEFAEQCRRIGRGSDLLILVDADHGYGNALNVRRTVEELEAAGVACLTIEDTVLPRRYGSNDTEFISREEFRDKLLAALDARIDPELVIAGRSAALTRLGLDETLERVRICNEAGVDALFLLGFSTAEQLQALSQATGLPIMLAGPPAMDVAGLVAAGVRFVHQGHQPYFVAMRALYEAYVQVRTEGSTSGLRDRVLPPELQAIALDEAEYQRQSRSYLAAE